MYCLMNCVNKKEKKREKRRGKSTNDRTKRKVGRQFAPRFSILDFPPPEPWGVNVTKKKTRTQQMNSILRRPVCQHMQQTCTRKEKKRPLP
jgi:hypothetical protein